MNAEEHDAFDILINGDDADPPPAGNTVPSPRGRWTILAAGASLAVGAALLIGSIAVASSADRPEAVSTTQTPSTGDGVVPGAPSPAPAEEAAEPSPLDGPVQSLVDHEWAQRNAEATGIPLRALSAYAGASLHVVKEFPDCGLGWNTLAGIGQVESHHGTINGSHLDRHGDASPAIVGIALTGETTQAIRDTDRGELDGDPVWDRAVGPMQFIPTTWAQWGSDGNGDARTDPQNIDDSALAAARYLCSIGGDLNEPSNWIAAVHAYNPTVEYNNLVAEAAEHYGSMEGH